jgi:hypothetical protein
MFKGQKIVGMAIDTVFKHGCNYLMAIQVIVYGVLVSRTFPELSY